ncbi:coat protein [Erysiphe necator associated totivirus 6]|nr:coat protein [Erysiphe necator associated totivirus 6]
MSAQIFDQLTGPLKDVSTIKPNFSKMNKYGIVADVSFNVGTDFVRDHERRGALFSNVMSPFGRLDIKVVNDTANFDGFNAKTINEYGSIDENMLNEMMKMSGRYRPGVTMGMASDIASEMMENHVGVVFNLLRMKIMKEVDMKQLVFKQDDVFYNDGHVSQSYKQYLCDDFSENFKVEFNENLPVMQAMETSIMNASDYCISTTGMNQKDLSILAMALAGWKCDYPIRLFSGSPQICGRFVLPQHSKLRADYDIVDFSARDVDSVIKKLVMANRIGPHFDIAYALVVMSMFTPVPRSIESNAWVSPSHIFNIPKASSIRGMIPELTSGVAFYPRPSSLATWEMYKTDPYRMYVHGLAVCEATYAGLFEVITASRGNMENGWYNLGLQGVNDMQPYRTILECCSLRFGKQFDIKWDTVAGPDIMSELATSEVIKQRDIEIEVVGDHSGYETYTRVTGNRTVTKIRSRIAKPVVFPVLSMGINDDRYYMNSLQYEAKMDYDARSKSYTTNDNRVANKMLLALRVGGYDATMYDAMTGKKYKNWAANANGHVMPDIPGTGAANLFVMPMHTLIKRAKNWIEIIQSGRQLDIKVKVNPKTYALFNNGKLTYSNVKVYNPNILMPGTIKDVPISTAVVRTSAKLSQYYYQDFLLDEVDVIEDPTSQSVPVGTAALLASDIVIEQDGQTVQDEIVEA